MKFRKKPVEVEARQFIADNDGICIKKLLGWMRENMCKCDSNGVDIVIVTLEGNMWASDGDWIIKGVAGEFYPCKPDIFEKTYDRIE